MLPGDALRSKLHEGNKPAGARPGAHDPADPICGMSYWGAQRDHLRRAARGSSCAREDAASSPLASTRR